MVFASHVSLFVSIKATNEIGRPVFFLPLFLLPIVISQRPLPLHMVCEQFVDLELDVVHIPHRLLDGGPPVAFALPPLDVVQHLVDPPLLLALLLTNLARALGGLPAVDELQSARLAGAVLLLALLAEGTPLPVATVPAGLFKVAHLVGQRGKVGSAVRVSTTVCLSCGPRQCCDWCAGPDGRR